MLFLFIYQRLVNEILLDREGAVLCVFELNPPPHPQTQIFAQIVEFNDAPEITSFCDRNKAGSSFVHLYFIMTHDRNRPSIQLRLSLLETIE